MVSLDSQVSLYICHTDVDDSVLCSEWLLAQWRAAMYNIKSSGEEVMQRRNLKGRVAAIDKANQLLQDEVLHSKYTMASAMLSVSS